MKRQLLLPFVFAVLTILVALCFIPEQGFFGDQTPITPSSTYVYPRPVERPLPDGISFDGVSVQQSALKLKSGDVLVQHYPKKFEAIPTFPIRAGETAIPYFEKNNPWYEGFDNNTFLTTFNCVSFAIGRHVGLEPSDHIDAVAQNGFQDPLQIILRDRYQHVRGLDVDEIKQVSGQVQDDDVVCFLGNSKGMTHCVHVARVKSHNGEIKFLSKMGRRGPILLTNMPFLLRHYGQTRLVKIYRLAPSDT